MGVKELAEGIMLQSIEDLWSDEEREDCISFFKGEEFSLCAGMAGMNLYDQVRLLNMVNGIIKRENGKMLMKKEKPGARMALQR